MQEQAVICGPVLLLLAGIPKDHPQSLILSLIHQLQQKTNEYPSPPNDLISQIGLQIREHRFKNSHYEPTMGGDMQSVCDCFQIRLTIYTSDSRLIFSPQNNSTPFLCANLYSHPRTFCFDSVLSIEPNVSSEYLPETAKLFIRMSSWNIRGATDVIKRNMIDYELNERKILICGIQESHLWCHTLTTTNYKWILGKQTQSRASRGVGFLVHHSFLSSIAEVNFPHPNVAVLKIDHPQKSQPVFLINVHKCSEGDSLSSIETGFMSGLIRELMSKGDVVLAGDLNCHFGYKDDSVINSNLLGNILLHEESNANGDEILIMCEILRLKVLTTFFHRSTKITWTNGRSVSQIDHVLLPENSNIILNNLQATWSKVTTDHKLLSWTMKIPLTIPAQSHNNKFPACTSYYYKTWNLSALLEDSVKDAYEGLVVQCFQRKGNSNITWNEVSSIACFCSEKILKNRPKNFTQEQQIAFHNYRSLLNQTMQRRVVDANPNLVETGNDLPPNIPLGNIKLLREAHRALFRARKNSSNEALEVFLDSLQQDVPISGRRTQLAFNYLKTTKRNSSQLCTPNITIRDWSLDLNKQIGLPLILLSEDDYHLMLPPPKFKDMMSVIQSMKNGKTPGLDNICIEMLKSSPTLCFHLYKLIKHAYIVNEVPSAWQETYSIPIPKIKGPKTIDDYRKLSLCSYAYKIYSCLLMDMLKVYLPELDFYQTGFVRNRSCDDLNFVLRNIIDYRWNKGQTTFIISLDLKKAFDTVKISMLPEILLSHGAPRFLVNRIISLVLTEKTCVLWNGEYTHKIQKGVGIKQGCCVSPGLFLYILNEAVIKTKKEIEELGKKLCTGSKGDELRLPLILAYADDSYIICENISNGLEIAEIFRKYLLLYGLEINYSKSKILIKEKECAAPASFLISNVSVPVVDTLKVLGTTINADMSRRNSIKPRVSSAIRLFRALLPFLKNLKAPMELLVKMHVTILVPSLIYGLNCSSLTKSNESTLMRREIYILKELSNIAHPRPPQSTIAALLGNKTINRKTSIGRIRYYYHVKRSKAGSLILQSMNYKNNNRRKVGRPIYDFHETLKRDFAKFLDLGIQKSELDEDFEFRDVIKNLTSQLYNRSNLDDDPLPSDLNIYSDFEMANN